MNRINKFTLYIFSSLISFLLITTNLFAQEKTLDLLKSLDLENNTSSNNEKMSLEEIDELEKLQKELEKQQVEQLKDFLENSEKNKSESASSKVTGQKSNPDIFKVNLFGIKLNDDISNYESLNKIMKPNWSYGLYPSSDPYITDNGIFNYVYTVGGGGFKKGDDYDGMYQHIYSGQVKNREADDMMTMLSEHDHFLVKPPINNDNFENYIIKFDPITKKTVAVLARFKESSKDDCEKISGQLKFWEIYGEAYKKSLKEQKLSFEEVGGKLFVRGSDYDNKKLLWERGDPVNEIAQFGFTCEYHSFSVDRWIYVFDLRNEAQFYDNLHSILMEKN